MGNLMKANRDSIDHMNTQLFNGSDPSIALLGSLIADGRVMEPNSTGSVTTAEDYIEKAAFGYLIPQAWKATDDDTYVFILDSGNDCSDLDTGLAHMSDSTAAATNLCVDNKAYYLVSATGDTKCTSTPCSGSSTCSGQFSPPPGLGELTDKNTWGDVSKADLIIG